MLDQAFVTMKTEQSVVMEKYNLEATHTIGNNTSNRDIDNTNSHVDKSIPSNDGLVERFSEELFAETHLRSFLKERHMNNAPLVGCSAEESVSQPKALAKAVLDKNITTKTSTDVVLGTSTSPNESNRSKAIQCAILESITSGNIEQIYYMKTPKELQIGSKDTCIEANELHYRGQRNSLCSLETELSSRMNFEQLNNSKNVRTEETVHKLFDFTKNPNDGINNLTEIIDSDKNVISQNVEQERMPRYFNGITTPTLSENLLPKRKLHKESTAFTIPIDIGRHKHPTKAISGTHCQDSNPNIILDSNSVINSMDQLESESSTTLFNELMELESNIEASDLGIAQTVDAIIHDETLEPKRDDDSNELSRITENTLHTIVEFSEPETPRPYEYKILEEPLNHMFLLISDTNTDSITTSWTFGSKDISYNCDDFLDETTNEKYKTKTPIDISTSTVENCSDCIKGGIYEYDNEDRNRSLTQYEEMSKLGITSPSYCTNLQEAAIKLQRAYRKYLSRLEFRDIDYRKETESSRFEQAASAIQQAFKLFQLRKNVNTIEQYPRLLPAEKQVYQHNSLCGSTKYNAPQEISHGFQPDDFSNNPDSTNVTYHMPLLSTSEWSVHNAATIIQKAFKRHIQTKYMLYNKDKQLTDTLVSKVYRSHQTYTNFHRNSNESKAEIHPNNAFDNNGIFNGSDYKCQSSREWCRNNAASIIQNKGRSYLQMKHTQNNSRSNDDEAIGSSKQNDQISMQQTDEPKHFQCIDKTLDELSKHSATAAIQIAFRRQLQMNTKSCKNETLHANIGINEDSELNPDDENKHKLDMTRNISYRMHKIYNNGKEKKISPENLSTDPISNNGCCFYGDNGCCFLEAIRTKAEIKDFAKIPLVNERNNKFPKSYEIISIKALPESQKNRCFSRAAIRIQRAYRNYRLLRNAKVGYTAKKANISPQKTLIETKLGGFPQRHLYSYTTVAHSRRFENNVLEALNICNDTVVNGTCVHDWERNRYNASVTIQNAFRKYKQGLRQTQSIWTKYKPSAPFEEDIHIFSEASLPGSLLIVNRLQQRSALILQKSIRKFIIHKKLYELNQDLISDGVDCRTTPQFEDTTVKSVVKSNWYVGDDLIDASSERALSEISFEETQLYIEEAYNPPYVIDNNCSRLEIGETNCPCRILKVLISNHNDNNQLENIYKQTKISEGSNTVARSPNTEDKPINAEIAACTETEDATEMESLSAKPHTDKHKPIIDQFINSERFYSDNINRGSICQVLLQIPETTETTKILNEFGQSQKEQIDALFPYTTLKKECLGTSESVTTLAASNDSSTSNSEYEADYILSSKTNKLDGTEIAIKKMQQRRDSAAKIADNEIHKGYSFGEPYDLLINKMENSIDTDEEGIVVTPIQHEETRESSRQSEEIICGQADETTKSFHQAEIEDQVAATAPLKNVQTIESATDSKSLPTNVTIDELIKYIYPSDYKVNRGSFCLDDDTSENIRRKIMAFSLSEANSDCFERNLHNANNSGAETKTKIYDDFNVGTALVDNGDTSTETESTIVSAVTKIQAGARVYLTRKRLGRTGAASDSKSLINDGTGKASFGNEAISESLEHLVKEEAAKRIQKLYRQHYRQKFAQTNDLQEGNTGPYQTQSVESTLAQKRLMLQRGDALRNNSTPDEGNSSDNLESNVGQQLKVETEQTIQSYMQGNFYIL